MGWRLVGLSGMEKRYEFTNAPAYSEKKLGRAFPKNGSGSIATVLTVNPT